MSESFEKFEEFFPEGYFSVRLGYNPRRGYIGSMQYHPGGREESATDAWGKVWTTSFSPEVDEDTFRQLDQNSNSGLSADGRLRLIKEWLRLCDEHDCDPPCTSQDSSSTLPHRLIKLGTEKTAEVVLGKDVPANEDYIALSHCWGSIGNKDPEEVPWCLTNDKIVNNETRFSVDKLPATFQDAIEFTRKVNKRYLWIDSFCINQQDTKEWEAESKRMNLVFKNAYCTIAATSAENPYCGFLKDVGGNSPEPQDTFPQSFSTLVEEKGVLNKRAWVLQERLLSRRTVHFAEHQAFWECSKGVSCGIGLMQNGRGSFKAEFPQSLRMRRYEAQIDLIQRLFKDYANREITQITDRPIAIASLATEMAKVLESSIVHGVFGRIPYLHRSLMWYRVPDANKPHRTPSGWIDFSAAAASPKPAQPPTWSWMAYEGPIDYLDVGASPDWDKSVQLLEGEGRLNCRVFNLRIGQTLDFQVGKTEGEQLPHVVDCTCIVRDESNEETGRIWFDETDEKRWTKAQYAVIGRSPRNPWGPSSEDDVLKYCVLVVYGDGMLFKRIGIGWVRQEIMDLEVQVGLKELI